MQTFIFFLLNLCSFTKTTSLLSFSHVTAAIHHWWGFPNEFFILAIWHPSFDNQKIKPQIIVSIFRYEIFQLFHVHRCGTGITDDKLPTMRWKLNTEWELDLFHFVFTLWRVHFHFLKSPAAFHCFGRIDLKCDSLYASLFSEPEICSNLFEWHPSNARMQCTSWVFVCTMHIYRFFSCHEADGEKQWKENKTENQRYVTICAFL